MHPMMITALGNEMDRERRLEREKHHVRHRAIAARSHGSNRPRLAEMRVRRLLRGISLRPRVS